MALDYLGVPSDYRTPNRKRCRAGQVGEKEEGQGSWERPNWPLLAPRCREGPELRKAVGLVGEGDSRWVPPAPGRGSAHSLCD